MTAPQRGEPFVWLEAGDGTPELVEQVADVLGEAAPGQYLVEYHIAAIKNLPEVFREHYGAQFGQARLAQTVIEHRDGRWRSANTGAR